MTYQYCICGTQGVDWGQKRSEKGLFAGILQGFAALIGLLNIGQSGQIIHAGVQCQSNALALLKRIVTLSGLNFGIVALINSG